MGPVELGCQIHVDREPLYRRERAEQVKKRDIFGKYGEQARALLDAHLSKYAGEGVLNIDDTNVLRIPPFNTLGTPMQLIKAFGGKAGFEDAVHALQNELYQDIA